MRTLRLMILLTGLLAIAACKSGGTILLPGGFDRSTEIAAMLTRHNSTRSGLGRAALTQNILLNQIAQDQADYMAGSGQLVHTDGSGLHVDGRANAIGYSWNDIGENIGYDDNPEELYAGWLGSPGHYANVTSNAFQEAGIGVTDAGPIQYWCVVFGRP
jgi:uncharacterized protein YkwD